MKITQNEFLKLSADVIKDLMKPTEDGSRLPASAAPVLALLAAKIASKLFKNEKEIEIINTED